MILAIDVGNSNIVLGGYREGKICFVTRIATDLHLEADQYAVQLSGIFALYGLQNEPLDQIAISSVVSGLTPVLVRALAHFSPKAPLLLSLAHAGALTIDIENPRELGNDIIASAIAVTASRPLPAVIIDMGTATKLTGLDANGVLRGVAIAPGLYVSLRALVQGASALAGIPLGAPREVMGRNTVESMKSGLVLGTADMLDGMIDRFAREMGGLATVVATGGAAGLVVPHCRHEIEVCDTLLLDGLYQVVTRHQ